MTDMMPRLYWAMYTRCMEQGFTPMQAMEVVKAIVHAQFSVRYEPPAKPE